MHSTIVTPPVQGPPPRGIVIHFGRYKGCRLAAVPHEYLIYLLDAPQAGPTLRAAEAKFLGVDQAEDPTEPDPTSAAVALPGVVWEWQHTMRLAYVLDPAALTVIDRGEAELKKLCTRYTHKPWLDIPPMGETGGVE